MERFRQRDRADHVFVPETNAMVPSQNVALVNKSVIESEHQTDTKRVVESERDIDSGSQASGETVSQDSAASVTGTSVTQEDASDQEVSESEGEAEGEAATLSSPRTCSPSPAEAAVTADVNIGVNAGVNAEDTYTVRNAVMSAPRADPAIEEAAHGTLESSAVSGSLLPQKACVSTAKGG